MTAVDVDKAARITELFATGHTIEFVWQQGDYEGWSPPDVDAVIEARGWELDASGRVPRRLRSLPPPETAPAPTAEPLAPSPAPSPADWPPAADERGAETVAALDAAHTAVDVDEWLAAAQQSPRPDIRRRAATALVALLQLRVALDDLARAERSTR